MEKSCKSCKHGVDLKVAGDIKFFACSEAFYKKIKFDSKKNVTIKTFIAVMDGDDVCDLFTKGEKK